MIKEEIECRLEEFVNSVYDNGKESGWYKATFDDWCKAVYEEVINHKTDGYGCSWNSNANRFIGRDKLMAQIREITANRLNELYDEGYNIKAIKTMRKSL